jgi:phosphoserine phosphatase
MTRLIVQHPRLTDAAVGAFSALACSEPLQRRSNYACWDRVHIDESVLSIMADQWQVDAEIVDPNLHLQSIRLAAFDMDSTLITIECVDEIADFAGRKAEVSAITEAAMRGEISDYDESLRRRVALLEGLSETVLHRVWSERLQLSPGARELTQALKAAGIKILLVSGGFTFFTERLREQLGLDFARANVLEIQDGRLTGRLLGPIVNAERKRAILEQTCSVIGCSPEQALAVGDGANDLKMMSVAGISVAYRAKPVVRNETTHAVNHNGLDSILRLFNVSP